MRFDGLVDEVMRSAVQSIVIETAFTPPIVLNEPFATGGEPSTMGSLLRPKVTFKSTSGSFSIAPYGNPPNYWPYVLLGLAGVGVLAILGAGRWGEHKRRK